MKICTYKTLIDDNNRSIVGIGRTIQVMPNGLQDFVITGEVELLKENYVGTSINRLNKVRASTIQEYVMMGNDEIDNNIIIKVDLRPGKQSDRFAF